MIPDVLFDESVAVVATDDGIAQIKIFDHSLQLTLIVFGDLATENRGDLVGLSDSPVGIEKPFFHGIERGAWTEDEIVAVLYLGEE